MKKVKDREASVNRALEIRDVFNSKVRDYEQWFERHPWVYATEIELLRRLLPKRGLGIEIGVGTGRFAAPLGIPVGIDISQEMLKLAEKRGVKTIWADAHNLPFEDNSFDYALIMVSLCFVEDPNQVVKEVHRILRPQGTLVVGIVDKNSPLGQLYLSKKKESPFYRYARFFSTNEVINLLENNGFEVKEILQSLFSPDLSSLKEVDEIKPGYGKGGFVGIKAQICN